MACPLPECPGYFHAPCTAMELVLVFKNLSDQEKDLDSNFSKVEI